MNLRKIILYTQFNMHKIPRLSISTPNIIQLLCVSYISIWAISPPLAYGTVYRIIAIVSVILWFAIELVLNPKTLLKPSIPTLGALFIIIYTILINYSVDGMGAIIRNLQLYIYLLFLIFFESYRKRNIHALRGIFWLSLILFCVWSLLTINALMSHSHIARTIVRSGIEAEYYMNRGIGGYGLVYSVVAIIPILIYWIKQQQFFSNTMLPILAKFLIVAATIFSIILVIMAGYSIALLLMLGSIIIIFIVKSPSALTSLKIIFIIIISWLTINPLLDNLAHFAAHSKYEKKLDDIHESILSGESIDTVDDRTQRYIRSIELFIDNPLLGTLSFDDVGKHSVVLDHFAMYGLFIGILFIYLIWYAPLYYLRHDKRNFTLTVSFAFVLIGETSLNNLSSSLGFVVFIFYPVAMSYIKPSMPIK